MKWGNIKISINSSSNINHKSFEIECFFIDLDGTALDSKHHSISPTNIAKIKEVNQHIPIVISTGRSFGPKVKSLMKTLDLKYAICQNGAIVANDKNEIIQKIIINPQMIAFIRDIAIKYKIIIIPDSTYMLYTDKWLLKPFVWLNKKHYFNMRDFDISKEYNKIVLAGCRRKKLFNIYLELKKLAPSLSIKTSAGDWIIEITDSKATKGLAAVFIANLLNIKPEKSVHIGDSMNDTSTLGYLGALIAMKNSSKHLLSVATHIGPNYKKGGLAKILNGEFSENIEKK